MKKETYKTEHPTIKEISIDDEFVNQRGDILKFVYFNDESIYKFLFKIIKEKPLYNRDFKSAEDDVAYTEKLYYSVMNHGETKQYNIKDKLPSLKDKIDLL